jgi:hypothetical protein
MVSSFVQNPKIRPASTQLFLEGETMLFVLLLLMAFIHGREVGGRRGMKMGNTLDLLYLSPSGHLSHC